MLSSQRTKENFLPHAIWSAIGSRERALNLREHLICESASLPHKPFAEG